MATELPRLLVITDRKQAGDLVAVVRQSLMGGARAILFREKDLPYEQQLKLASDVLKEVREFGALMLIASSFRLACELDADGIHLASTDARRRDGLALMGQSCHSGEIPGGNVDYITYSPIFASKSKPGYGPTLGLEALATLTQAPDSPPVYALGGITPNRAEACRDAGAYGVAVMGAIMRAVDPTATTAAFGALLG